MSGRVSRGVTCRNATARGRPYERHRRWSADGTWDRILQSIQADADLAGRIDWTMIGVDSTFCRAHQHAAGARKTRPRDPRKGRGPGITAPTKDSDGPGAA